MASSMEKTNGDGKSVESKQLLYSDVFGQSYQEDRLQIVGKPKTQGRLETFSVPHSSVLSQIRSFLPQLSDANSKMANDIKRDPKRADEINIECVDEESEGKHIEMDLSMIPTLGIGFDAVDRSDSESDESSDDGDNDRNDELENICVEKDNSTELSQNPQIQSNGKDYDMTVQKDLMQLKLPSSRKSRRKHKACIEEIGSKSCTYQEESANG